MSDTTDFYQLLGVPYTASRTDILSAYRRLMKRTHPDRQTPEGRERAEELAKRFNEAYTTLSNPVRRRAYDDSIRANLVQDEIMSRYVGGFYTGPAPDGGSMGEYLRREQTAGERRETAASNRSALLVILTVFGGVLLVLIVLVIAWAVLAAIAGNLF